LQLLANSAASMVSPRLQKKSAHRTKEKSYLSPQHLKFNVIEMTE
jgi:hypothetical protein